MDFSNVDNDQLLDLIKACLTEATARGVAMQRAAYDVYVDAKEAARIQAEATERALARQAELERQQLAAQAEKAVEAEREAAQRQAEAAQRQAEAKRIAEAWRKRKAIAVALQQFGFDQQQSWSINFWSRNTDERIYFEGVAKDAVQKIDWKLCLYVTGNSYNPPNSLSLEEGISYLSQRLPEHPLATKEGRARIKSFLKAVNERWRNLRIASSDVRDFEEEPDEKALKAYLKALELEESGNV